MLKHMISNESGSVADVINTEETHALAVATRQLKTFVNSTRFFINSDYGIDMNQDASAGGTPEKIHDGIDSVLWTASDIVGGARTTFNSADQNHTAAGAQSIKVDSSPQGDVFQLDKGGDLDVTGYVALSMWIYVEKDWSAGDSIEIYGWDTDTSAQVGTAVKLENYFSWSSFAVWHKIVIPLVDMGALETYTTLDALRIRIALADIKGPKWYLDDVQFEETGDPVSFIITPEQGTWLHVSKTSIIMADAYAGTVADGTMPSLPYNGFLGESALGAGINYQSKSNGELLFSTNIRRLSDLMQFPDSKICSSGSDGTNTWFSFCFDFFEPLILKSEEEDFLSLTIAEDLSGLLLFRTSVAAKIERRK